jgi:hypothetical protein
MGPAGTVPPVDPDVLRQVWVGDPLVQLNNPLGGMLPGADGIARLYQRIFNSPARVEVTFVDIVEYQVAQMVVFAGRETDPFTDPSGRGVPLWDPHKPRVHLRPGAGRWGQAHQHGSIDDPDAPRDYQQAVVTAR